MGKKFELPQHVSRIDGMKAHIAGHATAINAGMVGTHAVMHDAMGVAPGREPLRFA